MRVVQRMLLRRDRKKIQQRPFWAGWILGKNVRKGDQAGKLLLPPPPPSSTEGGGPPAAWDTHTYTQESSSNRLEGRGPQTLEGIRNRTSEELCSPQHSPSSAGSQGWVSRAISATRTQGEAGVNADPPAQSSMQVQLSTSHTPEVVALVRSVLPALQPGSRCLLTCQCPEPFLDLDKIQWENWPGHTATTDKGSSQSTDYTKTHAVHLRHGWEAWTIPVLKRQII